MDLKAKILTKKLLLENVDLADEKLGTDIFAVYKYFNLHCTRNHLFIKQR